MCARWSPPRGTRVVRRTHVCFTTSCLPGVPPWQFACRRSHATRHAIAVRAGNGARRITSRVRILRITHAEALARSSLDARLGQHAQQTDCRLNDACCEMRRGIGVGSCADDSAGARDPVSRSAERSAPPVLSFAPILGTGGPRCQVFRVCCPESAWTLPAGRKYRVTLLGNNKGVKALTHRTTATRAARVVRPVESETRRK